MASSGDKPLAPGARGREEWRSRLNGPRATATPQLALTASALATQRMLAAPGQAWLARLAGPSSQAIRCSCGGTLCCDTSAPRSPLPPRPAGTWWGVTQLPRAEPHRFLTHRGCHHGEVPPCRRSPAENVEREKFNGAQSAATASTATTAAGTAGMGHRVSCHGPQASPSDPDCGPDRPATG